MVEKPDSIECVILCGGADARRCGQSRQGLSDLFLGHLCWVAMDEEEACDPADIRLLGLIAIVSTSNGQADLVKEFDVGRHCVIAQRKRLGLGVRRHCGRSYWGAWRKTTRGPAVLPH